MKALKRTDDQVRTVTGKLELGVDSEVAGLAHLELEMKRQRCCQHVKARAEIPRGGGDARDAASTERHSSTARSSADSSGSHGITAGAWESAVSGSFSPWPVRTQTTRRACPAPCSSRPATLAADAGSQKIPSREARNR